MPFESEVFPLFIGGVCIITLLELAIGWWILKRDKEIRSLLLAHITSSVTSMIFLTRCLFPNQLGIDVTAAYGNAASFYSLNIALFGFFWAISILLILVILACKRNQP